VPEARQVGRQLKDGGETIPKRLLEPLANALATKLHISTSWLGLSVHPGASIAKDGASSKVSPGSSSSSGPWAGCSTRSSECAELRPAPVTSAIGYAVILTVPRSGTMLIHHLVRRSGAISRIRLDSTRTMSD